VASFNAGHLLDDLETQQNFDEILLYLGEVRHDIVEHAQEWKDDAESRLQEAGEQPPMQPLSATPSDGVGLSLVAHYQVNLLVDTAARARPSSSSRIPPSPT
jgi:hypothetical protein